MQFKTEIHQSTLKLDWNDIEMAIDKIAKQCGSVDTIVAVMRGGMVPARMLAGKLGVKNIVAWDGKHGIALGTLGHLKGRILIVDDIVDTGKTMAKAQELFKGKGAAVVAKATVDFAGKQLESKDSRWVVFPWEGSADKAGARQSNDR